MTQYGEGRDKDAYYFAFFEIEQDKKIKAAIKKEKERK